MEIDWEGEGVIILVDRSVKTILISARIICIS